MTPLQAGLPRLTPIWKRPALTQIKIGMPRALSMYTLAPLFGAYFEALGVHFRNVIYSDYTDQQMWFKGSRRVTTW